MTAPTATPATRALDLVGSDPRLALEQAERAAVDARRDGDGAAASTAHRAAGLALRELGDLTAAEARLRRAVRVAVGAGGPVAQVAAEARMSLAFILLDRGRLRAALRQADAAASGLHGLHAARLTSQRALILQRAGRLDQALAAYAQALPLLRRHGDELWQARALNNRGLLHAYRGALGAAEADLGRAHRLYAALGLGKFAADAQWNLGFVAARWGDAPTALARYDRAEATLLRQGMPGLPFLLGRCEVLLTVGLAAEARQHAQDAVDALSAAGRTADLAEGQLLLARAALADRQPALAAAQARAAQAAFGAQRRAGWALLARFVGLRSAELAGAPAAELLRAATGCAAALAAAGWTVAELDARLVAARAALRTGDLDCARRQLAKTVAAHRAGPLELRVRAWYADALLHHAEGDRTGMAAALRAGLALVERQQATVGATDLRVHLAVYGVELAELGLGLALVSGDARAVLGWAERWRAGALRLRPVRPPDDPELAEALAEVRRLSAELQQTSLIAAGSSRTAQRAAGPSLATQRAAEQRVTRAARTARSPLHSPVLRPPTVPELADALGDSSLVEFTAHDGRLVAVTLARGRCRLHHLGAVGEVAGLVEAAHFALRRLALGFGTIRSLDLSHRAAEDAGQRLQKLLLTPLMAELAGRPVVLVPTGALHSVPWALLPCLAGRPVRVAPSAAAWLRAVRSPPPMPDGRVVLVAGPRLPAADAEVTTLACRYPTATVLCGADASSHAVLTAMDGAELVHIAAHATLRADNPLFSAIELADGPLTVYDLEGLATAPRTVVLPACRSGVTTVRAGDELLGLVSALLALGTRTVIASVLQVRDTSAAELMTATHHRLGEGDQPAAALANARSAVDLGDPGTYAAVSGFLCFGA